MLDGVANGHTESKEEYEGTRIESGTKDDVTNWPAIFKRAEHKDELKYDIDGHTHEWPYKVDDEQRDRFGKVEAEFFLESSDGDEKGDAKDDKTRYAKKLFDMKS